MNLNKIKVLPDVDGWYFDIKHWLILIVPMTKNIFLMKLSKLTESFVYFGEYRQKIFILLNKTLQVSSMQDGTIIPNMRQTTAVKWNILQL